MFEKILGPQGVITDEASLTQHNTNWRNQLIGSSKLILKPASTEEVSQTLAYCNQRKLAVVPQAGNTS